VKRPDQRLIRWARAARVQLLVSVVLGLLAAGLAIAQAALLAQAVSGAVTDGLGLAQLAVPVMLLALVLVCRASLGWAAEYTAHLSSAAVKSQLRLAILRRAVELGPSRAATASSGELVTLATRGLDALDGYFARYLPQLVLATIVPLVVVAVILPTDVISGATVGLTLPLIVVLMALVGVSTGAVRRRRWRTLTRLAHHFLDVVAGLPTLKAFGRAQAQVATLERVTDEYRRQTMGTLRVAFLSAFVLELFATLSVALVAVGIGLRLVDGGLDLRTGLFVLVLAPEAYLPLRQLGAHFHASEQGLAAAEAAFAVLDAPLPAAGVRTDVPNLRTGELRIEGVSVRRADRRLVAPLPLSFTARAGGVVALTGESGAGKTALLQVIAGLITPDTGCVRVVGGTPSASAVVADLAPAAWRAQVAYVAQEPYLFGGSVADNVRLAAPGVTDADIRRALARVGLADVPLGLPLGERGRGLSAGQRRRVALCRAIVRDAPVVLLDEPTAGLDEVSERIVLRMIGELARAENRIVIVVAHRPGAIGRADQVVPVEWRAEAA
jgi:thiol reductant ABC exporter CydD subunit